MSLSKRWIVALLLAACTAFVPLRADKFADRLTESRDVFRELVTSSDRKVPRRLLKEARCLVVIPHMIKGALGIGGRKGQGVASCRDEAGTWSPPLFMKLSGGSFGLQIGAQASDVVLFLMSERSARSLLKSKFTLGADASVAAGPAGRRAEANTDVALRAEVYAYARSKGLFAGISLQGASLKQDSKANRSYYGRKLDAKAVLFRHQVPKLPSEARRFRAALP